MDPGPAYELLARERLPTLRLDVVRFVALRFVDDALRARDGAFRVLFLAVFFFVDDLLGEDLLVEDLLVEGVFVDVDRLADVLVLLFRAVDVLRAFFGEGLELFLWLFRRSRAKAVPPIAAPRAAAPVAASNGLSATTPTAFLAPDPIFFAPVPTTDAASPAFSITVDIAERPSASLAFVFFVAVARVMLPPRCGVS